jgi:hypothetical protein
MCIRMRQDICWRGGESDNAPTVCVIGHWVASIFSMFFFTYITGVCVCMSYKGNTCVAVVNVFPLAAQFTTFFYWF